MESSGRAGLLARGFALWTAVLAATVQSALADSPYNSSGVFADGGLRVERGFVNWPLQVSLAARLLAAPPGPVVLMQCDWELWRHQALDIAGQRPTLCLSRHCGALRVQKAALRMHRPAWRFHCLHAPGHYSKEPPSDAQPSGSNRTSSRKAKADAEPPDSSSEGDRRQALSGMTSKEVEDTAANATLLVVGIPAGGGHRLQPPVMAAMVRGMSHLAQIAVVSATERGRQVHQLALIEAPLKRAKVLYTPYNRYYTEDGDGIYQASFWQAEESKVRRAAVRTANGYAQAMAPLQERVGEALSRLGVRSVVHAYMGVESWLPPVFARMAASEAAREQLAELQHATTNSSGSVGSRKHKPQPGAETASLGAQPARNLPIRQQGGARAAGGHKHKHARARSAGVDHRDLHFHYFGLDTNCDQVQRHRTDMGMGPHLVRTRPSARPRAPVAPPAVMHVSWRFECLDAAHEGLPYGADLVATHDTLEHLPIESTFMFLHNVKASGARWLLIGGFANGTAPNREPREGISGYFALDPSCPPFNLRLPPLHVFWEEEQGKEGPVHAPGAVGDGVKGGIQAAATEVKRAGRRVVRLYDVQTMEFDDGLFDIFNYSSSAAKTAASDEQNLKGQQAAGRATGGDKGNSSRGVPAGVGRRVLSGAQGSSSSSGGQYTSGAKAGASGRRTVPSARLPVVPETLAAETDLQKR